MKITPKQHIYSPLNNIFFGRGGLNSRLIFKALDLGDTSAWTKNLLSIDLSNILTTYAGNNDWGYMLASQVYNALLLYKQLHQDYNTSVNNRFISASDYFGSGINDLKNYTAQYKHRPSGGTYKTNPTTGNYAFDSTSNINDVENWQAYIDYTNALTSDEQLASLFNNYADAFVEEANKSSNSAYSVDIRSSRNDHKDSARHGILAKQGTYCYYEDADGTKHYVQCPENYTDTYNTEEGEALFNPETQTYLTGIKLTGLKDTGTPQTTTTPNTETPPPETGNTRSTGGGSDDKGELDKNINVSHLENGKPRNYGAFWGKMYKAGLSVLPSLADAGKLINNLRNNRRVERDWLKTLHPALLSTYEKYSPVTGNFSALQFYNLQAADVRRMAARNATADASTNLAAQLEANRLANQYEEKGFLTDNLQIQTTAKAALERLEDNAQRRSDIANKNMKEIRDTNMQRTSAKVQRKQADTKSWDNFIDALLARREKAVAKKEERLEATANLYYKNEYTRVYDELDKRWRQYVENYNKANPTTPISIYDSNALATNPWYQNQLSRAKSYLQGLEWKIFSGLFSSAKPNDYTDILNWGGDVPSEDKLRLASSTTPTTLRLGGKLTRFQSGGALPGFTVAEFNVKPYLPASEKKTTGGSTTASKDDITIKDLLNLIKDAKLLPNEENALLYLLLGDLRLASMTGMGLPHIASRYALLIGQVNNFRYNKEEYSSAKKTVEANSALDDIAMLPNGNILVLPTEGENKGLIIAITAQQYAQLKNTGLFNTVTNSNLLYLRALDANYVNNNNLFLIVLNGVGLSKVYLTIKDNINAVADLRTSQHYYTKGSAEEKALQGLAELAKLKDSLTPEEYQLLALNYQQSIAQLLQLEGNLAEGPAGSYLITNTVKGVLDPDKVKAALTYLWDVLPYNQRNRLIAETLSGTEDEAKLLIMRYMIAGVPTSSSETYKPLAELTGGGHGSGSGGAEKDSNLHMNSALLALMGKGTPRLIVFNAGDQNTVIAQGVKITNPSGLGPTPTLSRYLGDSEMGSVVNTGQGISLNGIPIDMVDSDYVMLKNNEAYVVAFPSKDLKGKIVPQVTKEVREQVKEAEEEIKKLGINIYDQEARKKHYTELNEIYRNHGLQDAYDSNGNLIDGWSYFLVADVYIADRVLPENVKSQLSHNELFKEVDDRTRANMIANGERYINDPKFRNGFWWWQNDAVYEGLVWMAMDTENSYVNAGLLANNKSWSVTDAERVDALDRRKTVVRQATRDISDDGLSNLRAGDN